MSKSTSILIANRLEKFFGNIFKLIYPVIHWIAPKKRYALPSISKPKTNKHSNSQIPKIIWQTNFTNKVTLPLYINYLFNRLMSRDWEYRFVSHEERESFIKKYGTEKEIQAFSKLVVGASQADFWRVFTLNKVGGVYMDIEANFVWPLSRILKKYPEYLILTRKHDYTNYFIASKPNNPLLQEFLDEMVESILNNNPKKYNVYHLTGPGVFNRVIGSKKVPSRMYRYTCIQDTFSTVKYQYIDRPNTKWSQYTVDQILKK